MNSLADILAQAGLVTEDEAAVAKTLRAEIDGVRRELHHLRKGHTLLQPEKREERIRVLEARLRILQRTEVVRER